MDVEAPPVSVPKDKEAMETEGAAAVVASTASATSAGVEMPWYVRTAPNMCVCVFVQCMHVCVSVLLPWEWTRLRRHPLVHGGASAYPTCCFCQITIHSCHSHDDVFPLLVVLSVVSTNG